MRIGNVDRLLLFRVGGGRELTQADLTSRYRFEPDGSNLYYGLNQANLTSFSTTGQALNTAHQAFFDDLLDVLQTSVQEEKTVVLGLEPSAPTTFRFVADNTDLVRALARELNDRLNEARKRGKRLQIVLRYASEMNDRAFNPATGEGNLWGERSGPFKISFQEVRGVFQEEAPEVRFAFSPAIRADLNEALITDYWPGDEFVDIISCTWYVHGSVQFLTATQRMRSYFLHRLGTGKAFGFDELSGRDGADGNNDAFLRDMLGEAASLQDQGLRFDYATLFLQSPWGQDATLQFLNPP